MSITDELRKWAQICSVHHDSKLYEIADNIDVAHRSALEKLTAQLDESEDGWVRLPVDADGVTIRPGDRLDWKNGNEITQVHIHSLILDEFVPSRWDYEYETDDDGEIMDSRECARLTMFAHSVHHHKPTVEDVLYDSLKHFGAVEERTPEVEEWLHEQAAKPRMAGEGE